MATDSGVNGIGSQGQLFRTNLALTWDDMFNEVIHWRPNLLVSSRCNASNEFVEILATFYDQCASNGTRPNDNLKRALILPQLILQLPKSCKISYLRKAIERRLLLWKSGQFIDFLEEARFFQHFDICGPTPIRESLWVRNFTRLFANGKTTAAMRLLKDIDSPQRVLKPDESLGSCTVRDMLIDLHPPSFPVVYGKALRANLDDMPGHHPTVFEDINAKYIIAAARRSHGCAGSSGLDAYTWGVLLNLFGNASWKLAFSLTKLATKLTTASLDFNEMMAFTAFRLIPLSKSFGIRLIGIGDVARRIIAKVLVGRIKKNVQQVFKCDQLCVGQHCGIEAAVHSIRSEFERSFDYCILLIDAKMAFNSTNRQLLLHNVQHVCPSLTCVLHNTYKQDSLLTLEDEHILQ